MNRESLLHVNGIDLCVQTFGNVEHAPLLLIAGGASSMDWWEDDFCGRLAARKRYVIRYDQRDTGQSTSYPPGTSTYTMEDLGEDAIALLSALGIKCAHLVGMSLGGMIALRLALDHLARVDSLTVISTSPGGANLPGMAKKVTEYFARAAEPDWSNRDAVIENFLEGLHAFAGKHGVDEERARALVGRVFDRTADMASATTNHASLASKRPLAPRLAKIAVPTLVMHGTDDPLYPFAHAQALARAIPGARLLALPGVGHEMPPPGVWDLVIDAIATHTAGKRSAGAR